MSYERCTACSTMIPAMPEDATFDEMLCDRCYQRHEIAEFNQNNTYQLDAENAEYDFPMWLVNPSFQQVTLVDSVEDAEVIVEEYQHQEPGQDTNQPIQIDAAMSLLEHWRMSPEYPNKIHWNSIEAAIATVEGMDSENLTKYKNFNPPEIASDLREILAIAKLLPE